MDCKANNTKSTKGTEVFEIVNDGEIIIKSLYLSKEMATKLKGKKIIIQF